MQRGEVAALYREFKKNMKKVFKTLLQTVKSFVLHNLQCKYTVTFITRYFTLMNLPFFLMKNNRFLSNLF
jgi:hypothetical protein